MLAPDLLWGLCTKNSSRTLEILSGLDQPLNCTVAAIANWQCAQISTPSFQFWSDFLYTIPKTQYH
jgi:hypothetical protein